MSPVTSLNEPLSPWRKSLPRLLLKLALIGLLIWLGRLGYDALYARIETMEAAAQARAMFWLQVTAIGAYALLISIPFVPAVEIGVGLLVMEGAAVAPYVYVATVLGLLLAFGIGRYLSLDWLHALFRDLHMQRACRMVQSIKERPSETRLRALSDRLPGWLAPFVVRYRYATVAVLLNLPGNAVIGGGGGIMMIAGISRLFTAPALAATVLIAVLPVPLAVWLIGADFLQ